MSTSGVVLSVDVERYGDSLVVATAATDLVLQVDDVVDFADEDDFAAGPQWLVIGDSAPMQYVAVDDDEDAQTITLAAAVGAVYEAGEPVRVWDPTIPGPVVGHVAQVELDEADVDDAPVPAEVTHDRMIFFGLDNLAALIGARVEIEEDPDDPEAWYVSQVIGRSPVLDGTYIEPGTLPASSSGQTFSTDAPPATAEGYAEDHAWWQVVDGEVLGFWRATAGAWVAQEIVTAEALRANNAFIDALQTVDLSTVNLQAVNIDGGSIYIAQGTEAQINEGFSGTTLPAGWTATLAGTTGSGSAGANLPGPSVDDTPPAGGGTSALLIDFGAAGITDQSADGSGEVTTTLPEAADGEILVRYKLAAGAGSVYRPDIARLAIRRQDGAAWSSTSDMVTLDLIPTADFGEFVSLRSTVNNTTTTLADIPLSTDPSTDWHFAQFRLQAGAVSARIWRDGDTAPEWTVVQQSGVLSAGLVSLVWRQIGFLEDTRGQKLWIDTWDAYTYETGFKVNADGTGSWPALGLAPGDVAWHTVGDPGEPALQNGWTGGIRYRKSPTGDLSILTDALTIPTMAHGNTMFTLPMSHRPAQRYAQMFVWQDAPSRTAFLTVETDGRVRWFNGGDASGTQTQITVLISTL